MKNKLLSKLSSIVSHSHLSLQYIVIITIVKVDFENLGNASFFWQCVVILRGGGGRGGTTCLILEGKVRQLGGQQGQGGSVTPDIEKLHLEPMETDFWENLTNLPLCSNKSKMNFWAAILSNQDNFEMALHKL